MIFTYMGAVGSRPLGGKLCGSHGEELLCGWMYKLCRKERRAQLFRCQKWEAAISREGWHPVKSSRI